MEHERITKRKNIILIFRHFEHFAVWYEYVITGLKKITKQ